MTTQTVFIMPRMLTKAQAALYCGLSTSAFAEHRPPARSMFPRSSRWDVRDLDEWLDSLKSTSQNQEDDEILAKLG